VLSESDLDAPPELVGFEVVPADAGHLEAVSELTFGNERGERRQQQPRRQIA
jgi:hypothetical protein